MLFRAHQNVTAALAACVEACAACELACIACADACLTEGKLESLRRCIHLNLDCSDICAATARVLARLLDADDLIVTEQLEACACACATAAAECDRHLADTQCCLSAEACRRSEDRCR